MINQECYSIYFILINVTWLAAVKFLILILPFISPIKTFALLVTLLIKRLSVQGPKGFLIVVPA